MVLGGVRCLNRLVFLLLRAVECNAKIYDPQGSLSWLQHGRPVVVAVAVILVCATTTRASSREIWWKNLSQCLTKRLADVKVVIELLAVGRVWWSGK